MFRLNDKSAENDSVWFSVWNIFKFIFVDCLQSSERRNLCGQKYAQMNWRNEMANPYGNHMSHLSFARWTKITHDVGFGLCYKHPSILGKIRLSKNELNKTKSWNRWSLLSTEIYEMRILHLCTFDCCFGVCKLFLLFCLFCFLFDFKWRQYFWIG